MCEASASARGYLGSSVTGFGRLACRGSTPGAIRVAVGAGSCQCRRPARVLWQARPDTPLATATPT
eukprot:4172622-Lingulodinium_polyedra.AAC.1